MFEGKGIPLNKKGVNSETDSFIDCSVIIATNDKIKFWNDDYQTMIDEKEHFLTMELKRLQTLRSSYRSPRDVNTPLQL